MTINGEVVAEADVDLSEAQLNQLIEDFKGPSKQVPSMYSALKHNGKPLYWYARQGLTVDRPARDINIYALQLLSFDGTNAHMRVHCSKGTYIRSIAHDLGKNLNSGGINVLFWKL